MAKPKEPTGPWLGAIEQAKAELIMLRDDPSMPEDDRKLADEALSEWISAEVSKVDGIAAMLRHFKAQEEAATKAAEHCSRWADKWANAHDRLKNLAYGVMIQFGYEKLEGATSRLRRQANPPAVDVYDVAKLPDKYLKAKVTMRLDHFHWMMDQTRDQWPDAMQVENTSEVDKVALRAALQERIECKACLGRGFYDIQDDLISASLGCEECAGAGTITAEIPGARLKQGEHLVVE